MNGGILVLVIFILSCILSAALVLKKPIINFTLGKKHFNFESYFLGVLIGALILLATSLLPWNEATKGIQGTASLSPIGILLLFLSMVFISVFLDQTGFFEYCADTALKYAKGSPKRLFFALYITVSVLTIFTSNDIIILTFTPFVYYIAKRAKINPIPYLFAEFFAANTWSMMLYIGNPTNIIIASALKIDFSQYTYYMLIPTIAAGLINLFLLYFIFRKEINCKKSFSSGKINLTEVIKDKAGTAIGIIILLACIVLLSIAPAINIDMWRIALGSALLLAFIIAFRRTFFKVKTHVIKRKLSNHHFNHTEKQAMETPVGMRTTLYRMPWSIIPFILSLFLMVHALNIHGITSSIGSFFANICAGNALLTSLIYGFSSAISANFINNIPMTVAFVPVISHAGTNTLAAALATTIGSNLGANITPFGALAGIMWFSILKSKDITLRRRDFIKYGSIVTLFALSAALVVLGIEFLIF